jgi:signal transduction histidine kinase
MKQSALNSSRVQTIVTTPKSFGEKSRNFFGNFNRLSWRLGFIILGFELISTTIVFFNINELARDYRYFYNKSLDSNIKILIFEEIKNFNTSDLNQKFLMLNEIYSSLIIIILIILTSIIVAILISKKMTQPIEQIMQTIALVARGDLNARILLTKRQQSSPDELMRLASDFNAMTSSLQNLETERLATNAAIAHELRTPLMVLQSRLEAVRDDIIPMNKTETEQLLTQIRTLTRLVTDLRTLSLADAGRLDLHITSLDLLDIVALSVAAFSAHADAKNITLELNTHELAVPVCGDRDRLMQVMGNLFENAVRYTPKDGRIDVDVNCINNQGQVIVQDNGSGFPIEFLGHLFKRFYRPDSSRRRVSGGSGLGLSVVKTIVELHGGTVQAGNTEQGGAKLELQFPIDRKGMQGDPEVMVKVKQPKQISRKHFNVFQILKNCLAQFFKNINRLSWHLGLQIFGIAFIILTIYIIMTWLVRNYYLSMLIASLTPETRHLFQKTYADFFWKPGLTGGMALSFFAFLKEFLILTFTAVIAIFIAKRLTQPIEKIMQIIVVVAQGDLNARVLLSERQQTSSNELIRLVIDFNTMTSSLQNLETERLATNAAIAHELRTPLMVLQARLEGVRDDIIPISKTETEQLLLQVRTLTRLVADLRTLSLADAGRLDLNLEPLDLLDIVALSVAGFSAHADAKNIMFELNTNELATHVHGDRDRLTQVMANLFENAIRYTPNGGQVDVDLQIHGHQVQVVVRDSGSGFPIEALEHLFKRSYRPDSSRKRASGGSGLGLSVVKTIVELHGGTVQAGNMVHGGAKLELQFPIITLE